MTLIVCRALVKYFVQWVSTGISMMSFSWLVWGYTSFFFFNIIFLYSRFLLVIYFIHISVYMSIPISQFIPTPPPPAPTFLPWCPYVLFSTSVSLFLSCKPVHLYHFSIFHIYVLIHNIRFSLSNLLHSVWQSLGPSTCLQMTQFPSFLWLSNIPLYKCATSSFFLI